jgi:predicted TPR repeat methyltransferase
VNNIATSIAEKSPSASAPPNFPSPPEQAALWAQKAIDVSETVPESERTDECSTGCATAKANLAELAERAGRFDEALRLFGEAEQISKDVAFAEGVNFASLGRKRVQETTKNRNR